MLIGLGCSSGSRSDSSCCRDSSNSQMQVFADIVPVLPQGFVARVKHSAYIGIATFIGFLVSDWGAEHTLSGLRDDITRNWDHAAGNAVWAVLVANGILTVATAKRNGVGSHPTLSGTVNPTRETDPEG